MKHKPAGGTSMLSAGKSGGLSSSGNAKTLGLAPPPSGSGKIRSPLPPPPNDPAAARITLKGSKESVRRSTDSLSDFSELEVCLLRIDVFLLPPKKKSSNFITLLTLVNTDFTPS